MGLAWAWECVCADAAQATDVWVCPVEAANRAWVMVRLDGDRDQACGVPPEADVAHREVDTTGSVADEVLRSVADGAENRAGIMGADTEIVIDPCEYARNNSCE